MALKYRKDAGSIGEVIDIKTANEKGFKVPEKLTLAA